MHERDRGDFLVVSSTFDLNSSYSQEFWCLPVTADKYPHPSHFLLPLLQQHGFSVIDDRFPVKIIIPRHSMVLFDGFSLLISVVLSHSPRTHMFCCLFWNPAEEYVRMCMEVQKKRHTRFVNNGPITMELLQIYMYIYMQTYTTISSSSIYMPIASLSLCSSCS
jgi:hypothetical protein